MTTDPLSQLATMPEAALVDEAGLAQLFDCCGRSIRRAVARGELPPPIKMFRRHAWTAGAIVRHIQDRQAEAARLQAAMHARIRRMAP